VCIVERIDLYKGRATWRICAAQGDDDDEDTTPAASFIVRAKEIMTDAEQTKHDADEVSLLLKSSLVTFQELQSGVLARKSERLDITQIDLSHNMTAWNNADFLALTQQQRQCQNCRLIIHGSKTFKCAVCKKCKILRQAVSTRTLSIRTQIVLSTHRRDVRAQQHAPDNTSESHENIRVDICNSLSHGQWQTQRHVERVRVNKLHFRPYRGNRRTCFSLLFGTKKVLYLFRCQFQ